MGRCCLCPRKCGADRKRGQLGACRVGPEMRVSRAALHFWEEPPISGECGSGTIFFSGCSLGCVYCQNAAISRGESGDTASVGDVADICLDLARQGAMNINLVTPTHFSDKVREAVATAHRRGLELPVVWNTSGYESVECIRANVGTVDAYLTDFKYFDDAIGKRYSGISDYREVATLALDEMVRACGAPCYDGFGGTERMTSGVIVRHLLLPNHLDDSMRVIELLASRYGSDIRISIMNQYTPLLKTLADKGDPKAKDALAEFPHLAYKVPDEDYERLLDFADELGIEDYFWQESGTCEESFIPQW